MNIRGIESGSTVENDSVGGSPTCNASAEVQKPSSLNKLIIIFSFTAVVLVFLVAGTATTSISYPPKPPQFNSYGIETEAETALDGDYKLIGPLLLTSGLFMMVVTTVLCFVAAREIHAGSQCLDPPKIDKVTDNGTLSVVGGPFYLAAPVPSVKATANKMSFPLSRQVWTVQGVSSPDLIFQDSGKSSKTRSTTATLSKGSQLPYNPELRLIEDV